MLFLNAACFFNFLDYCKIERIFYVFCARNISAEKIEKASLRLVFTQKHVSFTKN